MNRDELILDIKKHLIEDLNLEDMEPADIIDEAPLFGEGLGLDSIDALEVVVILDNHYGIVIKDEELGRKVLQSVNTMADHILEQKALE